MHHFIYGISTYEKSDTSQRDIKNTRLEFFRVVYFLHLLFTGHSHFLRRQIGKVDRLQFSRQIVLNFFKRII